MSTKENKELVRRYMSANAEEIRKNSATGKDDFHAPVFVVHSPMGDMKLKDYLQYMNTMITAFPDTKFTVEDLVAEGDKVVARYGFTGTHKGTFMGIPATGKKVKTEGMGIFKISGGRLAEAWFAEDTMSMMQQLGAMPKQ
jgi:steroid delta-isomerase-like uncharacterized protein